jgi:hypothetical protein
VKETNRIHQTVQDQHEWASHDAEVSVLTTKELKQQSQKPYYWLNHILFLIQKVAKEAVKKVGIQIF